VSAWLWPANGVATLLTAVAAIAQPVTMLNVPCEGSCDPHGYVAIFSFLPALVVALIALSALGSLIGRRRRGLVIALVAALLCAGLGVLFGGFVPAVVRWPVLGVALASAVLAVAGLRSAPARGHRMLADPPYPS
jgi:hypothetical protein